MSRPEQHDVHPEPDDDASPTASEGHRTPDIPLSPGAAAHVDQIGEGSQATSSPGGRSLPPPDEAPSALLLRLFTEAQERRIAVLTDWLPQMVRERTGWDNIAEYLVAKAGLLDTPPGLDAFPDEAVVKELESRYRQAVRSVVHTWRENEDL